MNDSILVCIANKHLKQANKKEKKKQKLDGHLVAVLAPFACYSKSKDDILCH